MTVYVDKPYGIRAYGNCQGNLMSCSMKTYKKYPQSNELTVNGHWVGYLSKK